MNVIKDIYPAFSLSMKLLKEFLGEFYVQVVIESTISC